MATQTLSGRQNLFDVMKLKAPNGGVLDVANTLSETNDMMKDLSSLPANGGLFHQGVRTTSLPTAVLVDVGGTWGASKGSREPFVEALATIRNRFQSPSDVLKSEGADVSKALVQAENDDHIESIGQSFCNLIVNGPTIPQQNAVVGLMGRAPYNAVDSEYCFDVGGSGINLRSAWLMCPDVNTVHLLYNQNHPTLGVEREEKGETFVPVTIAADGSVTAGRWDIIIEYMLQQGFCIRDYRAVKRVANIPVLITPTADLVTNIIRAKLKHPIKLSKQWFLYCDTEVYTQLVLGVNDASQIQMSDANVYRTKLPMIGDDIIIRRMDALNHAVGAGETEVA